MSQQKNQQKISDIIFGKAGEVFMNIRLFLWGKKIEKIRESEKAKIELTRAKLSELYGGPLTSLQEALQESEIDTIAPEEEANEIGQTGEPLRIAAAGVENDETVESVKPVKKNLPAIITGPVVSQLQAAEPEKEMVFIKLSDIAKNSTYSRNYINYSARQGKLKAKKIYGIWHTTEDWLAEFTHASLTQKNKFKEKLSSDLGGNKKFVTEAALFKPVKPPEEKEQKNIQTSSPADVRSFAFLATAGRAALAVRKYFARMREDTKKWFAELRGMEGAKEIAKLRGAKLGDFWKFDFAKPAAAIISLVLLMAVGNITKADLGYWEDMGKKKAYLAYNQSVDGVVKVVGVASESAAKHITEVKVGKEKFVKIAEDILQKNKISDFEKKTGLDLRGDQEAAFAEATASQGGTVLAASVSPSETSASQGPEGVVLAAATGAALTNVGDIEVSAYLMDGENKEIQNGEYEVRFGIYATDRTETDPYPSDTDKGTRVWEETQKVVVENGLLKTYLGAVTPIPANFNFATSNYFIGIRVGEDAEMVPRKRIGAVPLARTAMNIAGQTIGNGAGNIPVSNGTLNSNLNADLLDGRQATYFQVAGNYQPAGTYDNYLSWKLQSSAADAGSQIKTKKGAIFEGANGIATSRNLSTLTITPTYGASAGTIAEGSTPIIVSTTGNLQGGGTGTAGGGINLTLSTVVSPTFTDITANGNFNLNSSDNLIFGGTTSLGEATSAADSGAHLIGVSTAGFSNTGASNVQQALADLDSAITSGGGGSMWTLAGGVISPTNPANGFAIGTVNQFQVSNSGAVTAATWNGNAITSGTGTVTLNANTLTLNASAALNQNLENTSSPTFGGMTLTGLSGILKATAGIISGSATTTDLPEGGGVQYYTDARARAALSASNPITYNSGTGAIGWTNSNHYIGLTDLSSTATGLTYTNTTGVFSLTGGYVIPTTTEETHWAAAYTNRVDSWSAPLAFNAGTNTASLSYNATNLQLTLNALNTIQDIATSSSPIFGGMTLNGNLALGANTLTTTNETVITHLNADLLDGQHASAFQPAGSYDDYQFWTLQANSGAGTNITSADSVSFDGSGIVSTSRLNNTITITGTEADTLATVTGRGAITSTQLAFNFAGAPFTVANSTVVTNLNADLLDGNHASAFQTVLTNPVTGAGATGYLTRWATSATVGSSVVYDDGTNVGIGTTATGTYKLNVNGTINASGNLTALNFSGSSSGTNTGDQMNWLNISSQAGTTAANLTNDTLTINGGGIATTSVAGDTLTITATEADTLASVMGRGATTALQMTSTLATGTSPFNVTSTTMNANLNADLLDGQHASAFQTALTNPVTGTGANHQIAYWTGSGITGSNSLWFDGTNVGIGTTGPGAKLHVNTGTTQNVLFGDTATSQAAFLYSPSIYGGVNEWEPGAFGIYDIPGNVYYGISASLPAPAGWSTVGGYYAGLGIGGSTSSGDNPIFGVLNSTQSEYGMGHTAFTVLDTNKVYTFNNTLDNGSGAAFFAGNVGIGTTNPSSLLYVLSASSAMVNIEGGSTTVGSGFSIKDTTAATNVYTSILNPSSTGNANLATVPSSATFQTGAGTTGGLIFISKAAASPIIFAQGGSTFASERMRISGTGNVGIGTTNPLALFSVGDTSQFQVNASGNVTGGTYNGVTLSGNGTLATGAGPYTLTLTGNGSVSGSNTGDQTLSGLGGAPVGATYITQTPDGTLSNEQALSVLSTGLVKNTTGTGVLSIASAGTDYIAGGVGANHQIAYFTGSGTLAGNNGLWFDGTNVGIGTTNPGAKLDILSSTEELRLSYDASNYASLSAANNGILSIGSKGTTNIKIGNDPIAGYTDLWPGGIATPDSTNYAWEMKNDGSEVWFNAKSGGVIVFTINNASPYPEQIKGANVGIGYNWGDAFPALLSVNGNASFVGNVTGGTYNGVTLSGNGTLATGAGPYTLTLTGNGSVSGTNTGDQNLFATVSSQSGSTTANALTDTLTVSGGGIATTSMAGDTLTITATEADTLGSVTGRGASTSTQLAFNFAGAPFTVANSTVVTNLNADLLDGNHASAFQTALTNPVTGTGANHQIAYWNGSGIAGSNGLWFDGTNVGIGTTNPLALLSVGSTSQFQVNSSGNVTGGTWNGVTISGNGTLATGAGPYTLTVPATGTAALGTGATNYLARWTGTNQLSTGVIYDNGTNVGIGTTAVGSYAMNVNGYVNATGYYVGGSALAPTVAGTITGQTLYWNSSAWTANTNLFNNGTNVGIGTTAPSQLFQVNNSGSTAFVVTSGGNVGIGVTSPGSLLTVYNSSGTAGNATFGNAGITATNGGFATGRTSTGTPSITASGSGSFASGWAYGSRGSITSSNNGSVAMGYAAAPMSGFGSITSSGLGSVALGYAAGGMGPSSYITASGDGALAGGYAAASGSITASGYGSFAWGNSVAATANWATAFGGGYTNAIDSSFMVGYSSTPTLTVTSANVGIGTTNPLALLSVGASSQFQVNSSGNVTAGTYNGVTISGNGTIATGAGPYTLTLTGTGSVSGSNTGDQTLSGLGGAPNTSKYILQQADASLPNAQAMGALTTGLVKNTTTTGVQSIAAAGTDYIAGGVGAANQVSYFTSQGVLAGSNNFFFNGTNVGIGTTNPAGQFDVNGKLTVLAGGNVGIGTTAPTHLFQTNGSANDYIGYFYNSNINSAAGGLYIRSDGTGSLLTLNYAGSNILDITPAQTTFSNPVNFASMGDVSMAYDLYLTNTTAGYIKFNGPGYIQTESPSDNLNLYLSAANAGYVVLNDSAQSQTIIPMSSNTYDLGSDTNRYANLWLGPNTLHLGTSSASEAWMSYDSANSRFNLGVGSTVPTLTVASNGNVGIGTTAPAQNLDVLGNIQTSGWLGVGSSNRVYINTGVGAAYGTINFTFNGTSPLVLNSGGGNVGIGTTNPQNQLSVSNSIAVDSMTGTERVKIYSSGINGFRGVLSITANSNVAVKLDSSGISYINGGNVGIGTTNPLALLSVGATSQFQVNSSGNVTAGTYNGVTISGNGTLATGAGPYTLTLTGNGSVSGSNTGDQTLSGLGGAPNTSKYILQQADASLPNAQAMGALTTGIVKNTTTTGVQSIATAGTDYIAGGVGSANQVSYFTAQGVLAGSNNFFFNGTNVGIGTTNPTQALQVNGNTFLTGYVGIGTTVALGNIALEVTSADQTAEFVSGLATTATNGRAFLVGASGEVWDRTVFYSNGTIGVGGGAATRDTFLMRQSAGNFKISSTFDGTGAANLLVTGNLGIGNTNPGSALVIGSNAFTVTSAGAVTGGTYNGVTISGNGTVATGAGAYTLTIASTGTAAEGTGTANYLARWTGTNSLSTGVIYDNGTNVGIGTTAVGSYALNVNGYVNATGYYVGGSPIAAIAAGTITGQTLYNNAGTWTANTNLFNNGTNVGIGTTNPVGTLSIAGPTGGTGSVYPVLNVVGGNMGGGGIKSGQGINLQGGNGAAGASTGGGGGSITLVAGNGGNGGMVWDGTGGSINITAGAGGNTATNGYGGSIFINSGAAGSSAAGNIILGNLQGNVGIGNTNPGSALVIGSNAFTVTSAGAVTGGTYNGVTISGNGTLATGAGPYTLTLTGNGSVSGSNTGDQTLSGLGGAPNTSKYILQQADASLPNAQAMGALTTGIIKNTTGTGVQSIAAAGTDYIAGGVGAANQVSYFTAQGVLAGSNNFFFNGTNVGIGTTNPAGQFDVNGKLTVLAGGNVGIGTTSPAGLLDVNGKLTVLAGGNVGIGTTNPTHLFQTNGSVNDYIGYFYNSNTNSAAGGLYVRSDGTGSLLTLNYAGTNILDITPSQSTFYNPVNFLGSGDVVVGYDIKMTNTTASYLKFQGPGYIQTESPSDNLDLTLSAANAGQVVINDTLDMVGDILPDTNDTYNLGSDTARFANLYLGGETIHLGASNAAESWMSYDSANSRFNLGVGTTASAPILTVAATGNVGIGTTSPGSIFEVSGAGTNGYITLRNTSYSSSVKLGDGAGYLDIMPNSTNYGFLVHRGSNWGGFNVNNTTYDTELSTDASHDLKFMTSFSTTNLIIKNATGNVGIGTTNPGQKLEVAGSGYFNGGGVYIGANSTNNLISTSAQGAGTTQLYIGNQAIATTGSGGSINGTTNYIPKFTGASAIGNSQIYDNGTNVGIGTTNPGQALEVNGNIKASTVIVGGATRIGSTGYINANVGTAAAPSFTFDGYTDVGMYRPAANTLGFATNGSEWMRINASGNVGIGTTNPLALFSVGSSSQFQVNSSGNVTGGTYNGVTLSGNGTIATGAGSYTLTIPATGTAALGTGAANYVTRWTGTNQLATGTIWDNGTNVGIGTTNPLAKLTVSGTDNAFRLAYDASNYSTLSVDASGNLQMLSSNTADSSIILGNGSAQDTALIYDGSSQDYYAGVDDTDSVFKIGSGQTVGTSTWLAINSSGNVGIGTQAPMGIFHVGIGGTTPLFVSTTGNVSIGTTNPSQLFQINNSGSNAIVVTAGGRVGIGMTSPLYPLQVSGQIWVSGAGVGMSSGQPVSWGNGTTYINGTDAVGIDFAAGSANRMRIDANGNIGIGTTATGGAGLSIMNGNVGIGTTSPGYALDVTGNIRATNTIRGDMAITLTNRGGFTGGTGASDIRTYSNGSVEFAYGGSSNIGMILNNAGNVGIGTTNPAEKLDVEGRLYLADSSAPTPTTNRLYSVSGNLYWNGVNLSGGGALPSGATGQTLFNNGGTWTATNNLYNNGTNVGIGTTNPGALLNVKSTGSSTNPVVITNSNGNDIFRLRQNSSNNGELHILSNGADNVLLSSSGDSYIAGGNLGIGTSTPAGLLDVNGKLTVLAGGNVGIGTTNPTHLFQTNGSVNDYIGYFYNSNVNSAAGGLYIRSDGTGSLLTLNYNGTNIMDVTPSQTTFSNPVNFAAAGDVSMAYDLYMTNTTAGYLKFNGPGYIQTESPSDNLDLTLAAANAGQVVINDTLDMVGDILPDVTGTYNLGSDSYRFKDLFLSSGTLHIGSSVSTEGTLSYDATNSRLNIGVGSTAPIFSIASTGSVGIGGTAASTNPYIYVGSNGNVGIGTTAPQTHLQITDISSNSINEYARFLWNDSSASGAKLTFWNNQSSPKEFARIEAAEFDANGVGGSLRFYTNNNTTLNERLRIDSAGNVGIGTTNPGAKLAVKASDNSMSLLNLDASGYDINSAVFSLSGLAASTDVNTGKAFSFTVNGEGYARGMFYSNGAYGLGPGNVTRDTFIRRYAANTLMIDSNLAGGAANLLVTGNVGIGTTNPSQLFQVNNSGASAFVVTSTGNVGVGTTSPSQIFQVNASGSNSFVVQSGGFVGIGMTSPHAYLEIDPPKNGEYFMVSTNATAQGDVMIIKNSGNVGIGTTNPGSKLTVNGNIQIAASGYLNFGATDGDSGYGLKDNGGTLQYKNSGGSWANLGGGASLWTDQGSYYYPNNYSNFAITDSGNVGIGTTNPQYALEVAGAASIGSGTEAMRVDPNGNVGIGTTSPAYTLDVNGGFRSNSSSIYLTGLSQSNQSALYVNTSTGQVTRATSSLRYKTDVKDFDIDASKINRLQPVTFKYNENTATPGQSDFGLIAEQVKDVYPQIVSFDSEGRPDSIRYDMLSVILAAGYQQHDQRISNLEGDTVTQQTALTDLNLKTTQNVETVQELQKTVDDNLAVISGNFSAIQTQLAVHDTEIQSLTAQQSTLDSRLTAAENKLTTDENNLSTFEAATNDTISAMLDTENMLTERVLNHEDRIKALEDKMATMTVASGGEIPANVVTQDTDGNVTLAGVFKAKEVQADGVVAGSFEVKNDKDAPTAGEGTIAAVKTDANNDGWDDSTNVDGKSANIITGAVTETAKIFVTFEGDPGARWWTEKTRDPETGKLTGQFSVNVSDAVKGDVKFSWFIVESK